MEAPRDQTTDPGTEDREILGQVITLLKRFETGQLEESVAKKQCLRAMRADRNALDKRATELDEQIAAVEKADTSRAIDM